MGERAPHKGRSTSYPTDCAGRGSAARLDLLAFVVFAPDLRVETARLATLDQPSPSKPVIPKTTIIITQSAKRSRRAHDKILEYDCRAAFFRAHAQAHITGLELVVLDIVKLATIGVQTQTVADTVAADRIALTGIAGRFAHVDRRDERFVTSEPNVLPGADLRDAEEAIGADNQPIVIELILNATGDAEGVLDGPGRTVSRDLDTDVSGDRCLLGSEKNARVVLLHDDVVRVVRVLALHVLVVA